MRIVSWSTYDFTTPNDITPCESPAAGTFSQPWFGATEDYSIVLNAPGSSASFQWFNGSTSDSVSNLSPGTYPVIITVGGCPFQDFATIVEPEQITFNPTITSFLTFLKKQVDLKIKKWFLTHQ